MTTSNDDISADNGPTTTPSNVSESAAPALSNPNVGSPPPPPPLKQTPPKQPTQASPPLPRRLAPPSPGRGRGRGFPGRTHQGRGRGGQRHCITSTSTSTTGPKLPEVQLLFPFYKIQEKEEETAGQQANRSLNHHHSQENG